jgi:8-oxo-dGTP pyrophosphatase MutT (NUDIX family)
MDLRVSAVADLVTAIVPADALEERHRAETLDWLASTDDVFRRAKPATPPRHLVSYVVPIDDDGVLLVAHRNAGLWLPPGGHVEPGEHPADTAARELTEELGVPGDRAGRDPVFLTVTRTVGVDAGHTDVSLWFVAAVGRAEPLAPDDGEFADVRWWSRAELAAAAPGRFDPHLARFLAKT